jgi:MFS family permease
MIAVERLCPKDIRASAQGLMVFATNGLGMLIGHFFSGRVHDYFAITDGGHNWAMIFMVPIAITIVAAIGFLVYFSEDKYREDIAAIQAAEQ